MCTEHFICLAEHEWIRKSPCNPLEKIRNVLFLLLKSNETIQDNSDLLLYKKLNFVYWRESLDEFDHWHIGIPEGEERLAALINDLNLEQD